MRRMAEAEIALSGKSRPVVAGYRPTLQLSQVKLLCNFDSVAPTPLRPTDIGRVVLRVWWDTPNQTFPLSPGAKFELLEGDKCVGSGVVIRLL